VQILIVGLAGYLLFRFGAEVASPWADFIAKMGPLLSKSVLGALAGLAVAVLVVSVWSIYILTRKEVKRVFQAGVNSWRRFALLPAIALVVILVMVARETGGVSLHYFTWSEEGLAEENRDGPRNRVVVDGSNPWAMGRSLELAGFERLFGKGRYPYLILP
jgi:hypothetical protein